MLGIMKHKFSVHLWPKLHRIIFENKTKKNQMKELLWMKHLLFSWLMLSSWEDRFDPAGSALLMKLLQGVPGEAEVMRRPSCILSLRVPTAPAAVLTAEERVPRGTFWSWHAPGGVP